MLDAFIIEEIKRREQEEERRRDEGRPRLEIPIEPERPLVPSGEDKPDRGVVIIDYSVESIPDDEAEGPDLLPPLVKLPFDRPVTPA
jgi:hypothetical protein